MRGGGTPLRAPIPVRRASGSSLPSNSVPTSRCTSADVSIDVQKTHNCRRHVVSVVDSFGCGVDRGRVVGGGLGGGGGGGGATTESIDS